MTVVLSLLMAGALAHSAHASEGEYGGLDGVNLNDLQKHAAKLQPNEDGMSMAAVLRAKLDAMHAQHMTSDISQGSPRASSILRAPTPPPTEEDTTPCYNGGDDCSDYESHWDPCNTFRCNRDEKRCEPEPREEGMLCGESLDDYFFGECNEGPGFCKIIESEFGTFGMCMGIPKIGIPCNDYNECTIEDKCKVVTTDDGLFRGQCMGKYIGEEVACNDWDNRCTTNDRCQLVSTDEGDVAVCKGDIEEGKGCNDYDDCTESDQCVSVPPKWIGDDGARCKGKLAVDKSCNDHNECTENDRCMEIPDDYGDYGTFVVCRGDFAEGRSCMDYNDCTVDDVCTLTENGKWAYCQGTPQTGLACDDYNQCTKSDRCIEDTSGWAYCRGEADIGAPCDLHDQCATEGTCVVEPDYGSHYEYAWCKGTPSEGRMCDDYNECTSDDICVLGEAGDYAFCRGTPNEGASCEDWNVCTTDDKCIVSDGWAWCEGGTPVDPGTPCNDYSDYTTEDVCTEQEDGTYCVGTFESS